MMQTYRTSDGDTLDYIAWKFYETLEGRVVEQLLDANPGIADLGPVLPSGVLVNMPDIAPQQQEQGVRLWS
ncbi:Contig_41, whole genome shotgun sequence [Aeromonas veronii]|uniref:Contig_41, whole genome shotgun sequence n=1 Tax=Aeromonas veronii TaxID=654 RepID=A0A653KZ09_AERVE|nr:Contig_41, whole genome shotgun sequence [Aeromonas veronii]